MKNKFKGQCLKNTQNSYFHNVEQINPISSHVQLTLGNIDKNGQVLTSRDMNEDVKNNLQDKLNRQSKRNRLRDDYRQDKVIVQKFIISIQQKIIGDLKRKSIQRHLTREDQMMIKNIGQNKLFTQIISGLMVIDSCVHELKRQMLQKIVSFIRAINLVVVSLKLLLVEGKHNIQTIQTSKKDKIQTSTTLKKDNIQTLRKDKIQTASTLNSKQYGNKIDDKNIEKQENKQGQEIKRCKQNKQNRLVKLLDSVKFMTLVLQNTCKQQKLNRHLELTQLEKEYQQQQLTIQELKQTIQYELQKLQVLLSFQQNSDQNINKNSDQNINKNSDQTINKNSDQNINESVKSIEEKLIAIHNQQHQIILSQLQKENLFLKHQIYLKQNTITQYQETQYDIDLSDYKHNTQRQIYCLVKQNFNKHSNIHSKKSRQQRNKDFNNRQLSDKNNVNILNNNNNMSYCNDRVRFKSFNIMNESDILNQPSVINVKQQRKDQQFKQQHQILNTLQYQKLNTLQQQKMNNQQLNYLSVISKKLKQLQTENKQLKKQIQQIYQLKQQIDNSKQLKQQQRQNYQLKYQQQRQNYIYKQRQCDKQMILNKQYYKQVFGNKQQRDRVRYEIQNSYSKQNIRLQELIQQIEEMKQKIVQLQHKQLLNKQNTQQKDQLIKQLQRILLLLQQQLQLKNNQVNYLNKKYKQKYNKEYKQNYNKMTIYKKQQQQLFKIKQEINQLKQQNTLFKQQIYLLQKEKTKLNLQIDNFKQQTTQLTIQINQLIQNNNQFYLQNNRLTQQIDKLNRQNNKLTQQIKKKQTHIKLLHSDIQNMNKQFTTHIQKYNLVFYQINHQLQQLSNTNFYLKQQINQMKQQINQLKQQINLLKQQRDKIYKYNKLLQQQNLKKQSLLLNLNTNFYSPSHILNINPNNQLQSIKSTPNLQNTQYNKYHNHLLSTLRNKSKILMTNISSNQTQINNKQLLHNNKQQQIKNKNIINTKQQYPIGQSLTPKKLSIKISNNQIYTQIITQTQNKKITQRQNKKITQTQNENIPYTQNKNYFKINNDHTPNKKDRDLQIIQQSPKFN